MIDFIGSQSKLSVEGKLIQQALQSLDNVDGYFYHGFPILSSADGEVILDGVLCSEQHGVTIFHYLKDREVSEELADLVDEVHMKVTARLSEVKQLTMNRGLLVPVTSIVFSPGRPPAQKTLFDDRVLLSVDESNIVQNIQSAKFDKPELVPAVQSRLQSLTNLKSKRKRTYVQKSDSKGAVLKELDRSLATLDVNQTRAVLENIDGVQRIRGLAGSGKTIVLARKIAHIHSQHPDWNIAVTFNTRSLKEQLKRLIEVFYQDACEDVPDWTKVNIIHAWGSPSSPGVYFNACLLHNIQFQDFEASKYLKHPDEDNLQAVCRLLLDGIQEDKQLYDLILVDEAQDFKPEFLRLCYRLLDDNRRLIYAYDELQNLGDSAMPSPEDIWGADENENPVVAFNTSSQDIILDVCYRNPGPILTAAHALGFGIYRHQMIQMFDYAELWNEIGYKTLNGELADGKKVTLGRTEDSSPTLLTGHNSTDNLIQVQKFADRNSQYEWIAEEIRKNIEEEEILPSDIVVIHPNAYKLRREVGYLRDLLFQMNINSSIAGVTSSPDEFFSDNSVTFTSIYRAKGNEAAMVYILNADHCNSEFELAKKRNILFTAMTRTKAWLRITGCGNSFDGLFDEFQHVLKNDFQLNFKYPTEEERLHMRVVNRDMTRSERSRVNQARKKAKDLATLLGGEVNIEDIPEEIRQALIQKLKG